MAVYSLFVSFFTVSERIARFLVFVLILQKSWMYLNEDILISCVLPVLLFYIKVIK